MDIGGIEVTGLSRSFSSFDSGGQGFYYIWTVIFMMYWYIAIIINIEQFSTILTVVLWFFSFKNNEWRENAPTFLLLKSLQFIIM